VTRALVPVVQELGEILRLVMRALASVLQLLVKLLWQALASVAQLFWELLRPMLLEALHELVEPLLRRATDRGVAAVLNKLESVLQEREQAQPAPATAPEAAAR